MESIHWESTYTEMGWFDSPLSCMKSQIQTRTWAICSCTLPTTPLTKPVKTSKLMNMMDIKDLFTLFLSISSLKVMTLISSWIRSLTWSSKLWLLCSHLLLISVEPASRMKLKTRWSLRSLDLMWFLIRIWNHIFLRSITVLLSMLMLIWINESSLHW